LWLKLLVKNADVYLGSHAWSMPPLCTL